MAFSKILVALALAAPQVSAMGMATRMCKETEGYGASVKAGNTELCDCCIDWDHCDDMGFPDCIGYELTQEEVDAINAGPPAMDITACTAAQCRILVAGDG